MSLLTDYRGRFAPSPTGPLHLGSLFAALISFLEAKSHPKGIWLIRIEDIDLQRTQAHASQAILHLLEAHHLFWDETETYQSQQMQRYQENLDRLHQQGCLFWCNCSRKKLAPHSVYPGHCRMKILPQPEHAIRMRVSQKPDQFYDLFQGLIRTHSVCKHYGDVVLKRKDAFFSYQLAATSDDIAQNITHIIRGVDLLDSTFWQREIYRNLNQPLPQYGHFPILLDATGQQKLSKQNRATPIQPKHASDNLHALFQLMQLNIERDTPEQMLKQAIALWPSFNKLGLNTQSLKTPTHYP